MEKMVLKRNPLVFLSFLLLLLLGAVFLSASFFLPRYIEKKILPGLGRQLSSTLSGQIYRIGFSAADFGDIILGDTRNPAISIGSIHADYSFPSLLEKKLGKVRINGLSLHLEISDGRLIMPGFDLSKLASSQVETDQQPSRRINLPFAPEKLQVSNGIVTISHAGKRFLVPIDLQLVKIFGEGRQAEYDFSLQMMPQGEKISLTGIIDLSGNRSTLLLIIDSLDLSRFAVLANGKGVDLNFGNVSIRGEAEIGILPFQLVSANLTVDPGLLHLGKIPVLFGKRTPAADPAISLEVKKDREQLQLKVRGFMREPLSASLELHGSISQDHDNMQSSGNFVFKNTEPSRAESHARAFVLDKNNPELRGDFVFSFDRSGTWKAALKSPEQKQQDSHSQLLQIQYDKFSLQSETPFFDLQGQGTAAVHDVRLSFAIPRVQASYDGAEIFIPQAYLQASYLQEEDASHGRISRSDLSLRLDGTKFQKKGLSGRADISLQGHMMPQLANSNNQVKAAGRITVANAAIKEHGSGVNVNSIEADIPWSWPPTGRKITGKIKAPQISWKYLDLGSFKADITFLDMEYFLNGNYRSTLLKGFAAKVSGAMEITRSTYNGEFFLQSDMTPFAAINLGIFDPSLEKAYFSGALGLDTSLKLEAGGLKGRMQVQLQNGIFEFPEKSYTINGIGLSMLMPSLPDLRTAPAQTLHFSEATIGNLAFNNGKLIWQLESTESIFLEEGVVQWAGGRVFTSAVRISPEMKGFVVPLFCDRLSLTEILQQFGVQNAAGEGTVSGRIPLELGKGAIRFEDGFLYSSPGHGGSVKVAAFDLLAEGIPKNTPQFAQVDFAAEALKNFQYNWVKLLLDTKGEDLAIQMQMDGKPVESLPFKYDSQTGLLQRIEDSGQGIMQPIRLDVNFRLPLNRFLGYSGKIQDILKNIK
jgi:hypothetical protein